MATNDESQCQSSNSSIDIDKLLTSLSSDTSMLPDEHEYVYSDEFRAEINKLSAGEIGNSESVAELVKLLVDEKSNITLKSQTDLSLTPTHDTSEVNETEEQHESSDTEEVAQKPKKLKRHKQDLPINIAMLPQSALSLSSTESLLLRNKYQYASDYQPYEHSSIHKELQTKGHPVPIYSSPKSCQPLLAASGLIVNLKNNLFETKIDEEMENILDVSIGKSYNKKTIEEPPVQSDKREFLENLTKSIVDSENYFQKCLTELNKCAARVVQHKGQPSTIQLPIVPKKQNRPIPPKPELKISHQHNSKSENDEKVREIERTLKEIDENKLQTTEKKLNRQYKEDLSSLIEKLKFLASYKKKVNIRPRRRGKIAKEKIETLEKSRRYEDAMTNNYEDVVTQMEHDSGGRPSKRENDIKNSVQKVVEWKRAYGVVTTLSNEEMKQKRSPNITPRSKKELKTPESMKNSRIKYFKDSKKRDFKELRVVTAQKTPTNIRSIKNLKGSKSKLRPKLDEKLKQQITIDPKKYKKAIEKVIKLTEQKANEIPDTGRSSKSDSPNTDDIKKLEVGTGIASLRSTNMRQAVLRTEDEETRLLSKITPEAVAPFSDAEYNALKQQQRSNSPQKSNEVKTSLREKKHKSTDASNKVAPAAASINMSDIQYLQSLITDPNARFKSSMTIMPVTVKNYKTPPIPSKKDVAEKPLETTSPKKKIDMTNILNVKSPATVKSPVKSYIRGNHRPSILNNQTTTRPPQIFKEMLDASNTIKPHSRNDTNIRKKFRFPTQKTDRTVMENMKQDLRSRSEPPPIFLTNSPITPTPLPYNDSNYISQKQQRINNLIDDILTLASPPHKETNLDQEKNRQGLQGVQDIAINAKNSEQQIQGENIEMKTKKIELGKGAKKMRKVTNELQQLMKSLPLEPQPNVIEKSAISKSEPCKKTNSATSERNGSEGEGKNLANEIENKNDVRNIYGAGLSKRLNDLALPKRRHYLQQRLEQYKNRSIPVRRNRDEGALYTNVLNALDKVIHTATRKNDSKNQIKIPSTIEEEIHSADGRIKQNIILDERKLYMKSINTLSKKINIRPELKQLPSYLVGNSEMVDVTEIMKPKECSLQAESCDQIAELTRTVIVEDILNDIIARVFRKAANDPAENNLSEHYSSSTLFRKLGEVLSQETFSLFTNSDTSFSSLKYESSEDIVSDRAQNKKDPMILGVKFYAYIPQIVHYTKFEYLTELYYPITFEDKFPSTSSFEDYEPDALSLFGFERERFSVTSLAVRPLTPRITTHCTKINVKSDFYLPNVMILPEIYYISDVYEILVVASPPDDNNHLQSTINSLLADIVWDYGMEDIPFVIEQIDSGPIINELTLDLEDNCSPFIEQCYLEENISDLSGIDQPEESSSLCVYQSSNHSLKVGNLRDNDSPESACIESSSYTPDENVCLARSKDNTNMGTNGIDALYKDIPLFVLYSVVFTTVFGCFSVHPFCE